jgi:hypothetical protein
MELEVVPKSMEEIARGRLMMDHLGNAYGL